MIATCVRSMSPRHDYALHLENTLADMNDIGKALEAPTTDIRPMPMDALRCRSLGVNFSHDYAN